MTVYVDSMRARYGRMVMCHMMADTTDELVAMADAIGVARRWIQHAGTPMEHFDIALCKRAEAVRLGAREVGRREIGEIIAARRAAVAGAAPLPTPSARRGERGMRSDLIDLEVIYQHATERAVCVRETETSPDVWLPLSAVEIEGDERRGGVVTLTGPVRLLTEKGLL